MLQLEVLIFEAVPVDGHAASPVAPHKVPSLDHEVFDDTVERASLVPYGDPFPAELPCAKLSKVLRSLGHDVRKEHHFYTPYRVSSDRDVEEDNRVRAVVKGVHLCFPFCLSEFLFFFFVCFGFFKYEKVN